MNRLKQKFTKNPEAQFEEIWYEYYPKLTIFLKTSFNISYTDDAVQEIMLKIYRNIKKYNSSYSLSTWIYTIARNHAIDLMKKENTIVQTIRAAGLNAATSKSLQTPETILLEKELQSGIEEYIENLPPEQREISFLKFHENLKYSDISRITEIPAGTIKYHVHIIKKNFAEFYGEHYEN